MNRMPRLSGGDGGFAAIATACDVVIAEAAGVVEEDGVLQADEYTTVWVGAAEVGVEGGYLRRLPEK